MGSSPTSTSEVSVVKLVNALGLSPSGSEMALQVRSLSETQMLEWVKCELEQPIDLGSMTFESSSLSSSTNGDVTQLVE